MVFCWFYFSGTLKILVSEGHISIFSIVHCVVNTSFPHLYDLLGFIDDLHREQYVSKTQRLSMCIINHCCLYGNHYFIMKFFTACC